MQKTAVLIVGGGVVGLSAALFLLEQGIQPLLVERHRGTSIHPRARGFDVRTMELYRELGLGEVIREAGKALAPAWGILKHASLAVAMEKRTPSGKKGPEHIFSSVQELSPVTSARCTQDLSEPLLLAAAKERGAVVRYYTELVSFTQDHTGVSAVLRDRDSGEEQQVRASYLIAADGAKSPVRTALHAATVGRGALSDLLNIYFEAPLGEFVRGKEFSILLVKRSGFKGMLTSINNDDKWVFHLHCGNATDLTEERILPVLRDVIGIPGVPIRIISILPWQPTIRVVEAMQHDRVFLAGDAAHVMTPYGGKGANTGIQDAHNLAWKLAAVLKGRAAPALLGTYSRERQPVGLRNAIRSGKWADKSGLLKRSLPMVTGMIGWMMVMRVLRLLGLRSLCRRAAMHGLGDLVGLPVYTYNGKGRLPHLWIKENVSTLDLAGGGFVLITGEQDADWKEAAGALGNITVHSIGTLRKKLRIRADGAVLVRPDGFIACRMRRMVEDPAGFLKMELGKLCMLA